MKLKLFLFYNKVHESNKKDFQLRNYTQYRLIILCILTFLLLLWLTLSVPPQFHSLDDVIHISRLSEVVDTEAQSDFIDWYGPNPKEDWRDSVPHSPPPCNLDSVKTGYVPWRFSFINGTSNDTELTWKEYRRNLILQGGWSTGRSGVNIVFTVVTYPQSFERDGRRRGTGEIINVCKVSYLKTVKMKTEP